MMAVFQMEGSCGPSGPNGSAGCSRIVAPPFKATRMVARIPFNRRQLPVSIWRSSRTDRKGSPQGRVASRNGLGPRSLGNRWKRAAVHVSHGGPVAKHQGLNASMGGGIKDEGPDLGIVDIH